MHLHIVYLSTKLVSKYVDRTDQAALPWFFNFAALKFDKSFALKLCAGVSLMAIFHGQSTKRGNHG